jgi:hypothetical protein
MPIDCKNYAPKDVLQLLKGNPTFNGYVQEGRNWNDVLTYVKFQMILTKEQELEIEKYYKLKTK